MEYTTKEYEEDIKISEYTFSKYFTSNWRFKDDLIQVSLIQLWKARQKLDYSKNSRAYLFRTSKVAMLDYLFVEFRRSSPLDVSANTLLPSGDGELLDILCINEPSEFEQQESFNFLYSRIAHILATNKKILRHNNKFQDIAKMYFLDNKPILETSKHFGVARQYVYSIIQYVRKILQDKLKGDLEL